MTATRRASGAAFNLRPGESITFVLPVTPRTKKNSRVHAKVRGRTVPLPSEAYKKMARDVSAWAQEKVVKGRWACWLDLQQFLNCEATFYRDANRGDAVGYYQALADALESAGVLRHENDPGFDSSGARRGVKNARSCDPSCAVVWI